MGAESGPRGDHWNTPQVLIDRVLAFNPVIGLDPCSNATSIVPATHKFDGSVSGKDGLRMGWSGYGLVYVNPPYGRGLVGQWAERCADDYESNMSVGDDIIGLFPAAVGSGWFQDHIFGRASAICFWRGRLRFLGASSSARFDSAVVYWGSDVSQFMCAFVGVGEIVDWCGK